MEICFDCVGTAKFTTTLHLLKGYWQVPVTARASVFATPDNLLQYTVMAFGLRNAPATIQRLMNRVLGDVLNCTAYLDDVVVYSDMREQHVKLLQLIFTHLSEASLVLNLNKCEFGKGIVSYLGKLVGGGMVKPLGAKTQAISAFPKPTTRCDLGRFLAMPSYYRCFCKNFSGVVHPSPTCYATMCQSSFDAVKSLLTSSPVLSTPDLKRPFNLEVDASGTGAGAVLIQQDNHGLDHPVC